MPPTLRDNDPPLLLPINHPRFSLTEKDPPLLLPMSNYSTAGISSSRNNNNMKPKHPSGPLHNSKFKAKLCRSWERTGACAYKDKCQFAHGQHELDEWNTQRETLGQIRKKIPQTGNDNVTTYNNSNSSMMTMQPSSMVKLQPYHHQQQPLLYLQPNKRNTMEENNNISLGMKEFLVGSSQEESLSGDEDDTTISSFSKYSNGNLIANAKSGSSAASSAMNSASTTTNVAFPSRTHSSSPFSEGTISNNFAASSTASLSDLQKAKDEYIGIENMFFCSCI